MVSLKELNEKYDLEIGRIIDEIQKNNLKNVLLQFPDGLKPYASLIVDYLEEQTHKKVNFFIWFGTCFGACDTPILPEKIKNKIDLVIQFGHNELMPQY